MGCQNVKIKKPPQIIYTNPELISEQTFSWSNKFITSKTNFDARQVKRVYCLDKNPILLRRQKQKAALLTI